MFDQPETTSTLFQSTLPARGATAFDRMIEQRKAISIHAPRTGSDDAFVDGERDHAISIHAPRTGSDPRRNARKPFRRNFNPRSPHGERHPFDGFTAIAEQDFNPRSPHGERQMAWLSRSAAIARFQSTLPARGATISPHCISRVFTISIHAPRTGSDLPAIL